MYSIYSMLKKHNRLASYIAITIVFIYRLMLEQHLNWCVAMAILQRASLLSHKSKMIQFVLLRYKTCHLQPVQAHAELLSMML